MNASSTTAKPVITIRKASEPSTVTATGSAITGGTLTVPVTVAKGNTIVRNVTPTRFEVGDHIVLQVSTAATKALAIRAFAEVDMDWETVANMGATTVTA